MITRNPTNKNKTYGSSSTSCFCNAMNMVANHFFDKHQTTREKQKCSGHRSQLISYILKPLRFCRIRAHRIVEERGGNVVKNSSHIVKLFVCVNGRKSYERIKLAIFIYVIYTKIRQILINQKFDSN